MKIAFAATVSLTSLALAQSPPAPGTVREAAPIDWEAYQLAVKTARPLSEKTRAGGFGDAIKQTGLPVLMATHEAVKAAPSFQTQGGSYVVNYRLPGMQIAVLGSASQIVSSAPSAHAAATPTPTFEVNEDITDLTFRRFGATYTVRASCREANDHRCTSPEFLTQFMQSLIPIGR